MAVRAHATPHRPTRTARIKGDRLPSRQLTAAATDRVNIRVDVRSRTVARLLWHHDVL